MIRRVAGLLLHAWVLAVKLCLRILGRNKPSQQVAGERSSEPWQEDKWEEWAPVGVVVEKQEDPITNKVSSTEVPPKVDEDDMFRDMQPEIKVTPKIRLKVQHKAADIKFTVDPTFHTANAGSELSDWPDEEEGEDVGWETGLDTTDIVQQTKAMMREKRAEERKKRRQQQQQQIAQSSSGRPTLGASRITQ